MTGATFRNPIIAGGVGDDHGDPFAVRYLDAYYLYHTGETAGRKGVSVHRSTNLVDWEFAGYALEPANTGWAWSDLWAPEVVYERGTFYMYISATRRLAGRRGRWQRGEGDDAGRRLGLARSSTPLGPFVWDDEPLLQSWSIDGHPFRDDDGTLWLFWNVRNEHTAYVDGTPGTGLVCDRLVAPDRLAGRPRPVVSPSQRWEGNREGDFFWNEGPYVLKRRGVYYLMYSGGYFHDETYAIGLARAPAPVGPWEKFADNPLVRGTDEIRGPGHHSFVSAPDAATRYALYHGYVGTDSGRKIHLDRMRWGGDRPLIFGPTAAAQPRPPDPVYDDAVPHWFAETWARGTWVEVCGRRFALEPDDVWHQVEVVHLDNRFGVRIGGVLRASYATPDPDAGPAFASDGDIGPTTTTTGGADAGLHSLPAHSIYSWRWGGGGPLELSLAARGEVTVWLDGDGRHFDGDGDAFRVIELRARGGAETIAVEAGAGGAAVADVAAYARP